MHDDLTNLHSDEIESLNQAISVITDSLDDLQYIEYPYICSGRHYTKLISNSQLRKVLNCYFDVFCAKESFSAIDDTKLLCADKIIMACLQALPLQNMDPLFVQEIRKIQSNMKAVLQIARAIANLGSSTRHRQMSEQASNDLLVSHVPDDDDEEEDMQPELHESPWGHNNDNINAVITPRSNRQEMRLVLFQRRTDEPLGIAVKMTDDRCIISRIIHGGLIHRQGILQVGDEIREINGIPLMATKIDTIQERLQHARGNISFKILPTNRTQINLPCQMFIKAMFNYDPMSDPHNPCPRVGIAFKIGDVLRVLSKDDYNWWQASKVTADLTVDSDSPMDPDDVVGVGGLIPSPELQEWRSANESSDKSSQDQKSKDGNCGMFLKRRKYKDKYLTKHNAIFQQLDIPTYEEVMRVETFDWKTVVLLGAHGVGRRHIKNTLISSQPDRYAYPIPHTTRLMPSSEENGKKYWFVTADEMLSDIAKNGYLEYGTHEHAMYGTKLDTIRSIINGVPSKMAVLDVEPQALKVLRSAEFAPIIVFIAAPVLAEIRCIREASDDDCLERLVRESELLQRMYGHLFDITIVNIDIDETVAKLRAILEKKFYTGPQWVSAKWIY
ncbi:hypothetical protein ACOME3_008593 [Neoechinorhynchus agilis]